MGMLVDGVWHDVWYDTKETKGHFQRTASQFRNWITADGAAGPTGTGGFKAEAGRYHLYVSLACPWAHRTLIFRKLKKLEDLISVSIVDPLMLENGWEFKGKDGGTVDSLFGAKALWEIYVKADPHYSGRVTVPVLWDKQTGTIVNNESADILRMLNGGFGELARNDIHLYPAGKRTDIDSFNARIYPALNNGVYRAGFATTQVAYEEAFRDVFDCLDSLETELEGKDFLFAINPTESDIRLFVTLVRFDLAYHGLFKCNLRRLSDYANLQSFCRRMYDWPGIAETVSFDHIKRGYYSITTLNPSGIMPLGPALDELF